MDRLDALPNPPSLDAKVARGQGVVDELLDVGMKLLRGIDPDGGSLSGRDPALAFSRLSQALRLTILLDLRLDDILAGGSLARAAQAPRAGSTRAEADNAEDACEPAERSDAGDRGDRERGDPDEIGQALSRPMTELAAAICKAFGLSAPETQAAVAAFAELAANDPAADDLAAETDHRDGPGEPLTALFSRQAGAPPARRRDALGP